MRPTLPRMAGHANTVHMDPALIKYANNSVNRFKHFRWTPRTAWISFAYVVAVPSIIGYVAYWSDGKYDMRGKRKGDTIVEW
ncbi:hypothetical protein EG328_008706 [Venturia inaequalis]|uniref:NADH dehydrogenase [ubiquinone] 1 beta subcomplex subunit 4 n=1 Tax=Venturia inaequalis TaxID=5025 RepID=A0A8H3VNK4_VENIN|nr:hypothetical protein EG328_008706 [Venturia inaequalis]KAE9990958.1 hypothetical protein EG327_000671 [Venturia inaequalis]RDI83059.1 putative amidase [Venturia inaequalis]